MKGLVLLRMIFRLKERGVVLLRNLRKVLMPQALKVAILRKLLA
jgi:hypothetical protein